MSDQEVISDERWLSQMVLTEEQRAKLNEGVEARLAAAEERYRKCEEDFKEEIRRIEEAVRKGRKP